MTRWRTVAGGIAVVAGVGGAVAAVTADRERDPGLADVDGATTFELRGCAGCHDGPDSVSAVGPGPPLVDAAQWAGTRRPGLDAAAYLAESLRSPGAFLSPSSTALFPMPMFALTDEEIDDLVAYLLGE